MKELWRRVTAGFANLSGRERMLVAGAGGMLALALVYLLVIMPALNWGDGMTQRRVLAEQQLQAMTRLRGDFDDVHQRVSAVEKRIENGPRGNLRTTLEALAQRSLVKVESMEPQSTPANDTYRETKVEVEMKGVTLPQTVNYLDLIETAPQVLSVKALRIRTRGDKQELLDVSFTVSSFERL